MLRSSLRLLPERFSFPARLFRTNKNPGNSSRPRRPASPRKGLGLDLRFYYLHSIPGADAAAGSTYRPAVRSQAAAGRNTPVVDNPVVDNPGEDRNFGRGCRCCCSKAVGIAAVVAWRVGRSNLVVAEVERR